MIVTLIIAAVEAAIRFASDQATPLPVAFNVGPAFLALAIVGPIAKLIDLRRAPKPAAPATVPANAVIPSAARDLHSARASADPSLHSG